MVGQPNKELELYLDLHTSQEDSILYELSRYTNLTARNPRMLSGNQQGLFIQMLCKMLKPQRVLEIGTFTGYSAICIARGIMPNGFLDTIEVNDELEETITKYFSKAGVEKHIKLHIGDALYIIATLNDAYDLVFIDGEKREYSKYYSMVFPKVRLGGFIIVDNVLWDGKVLNSDYNDEQTKSIIEFNQMVQNDNRVQNLILPLRDGLMLIQKVSE